MAELANADYTTTTEFQGAITVTVHGTVRRGQGMRHFGTSWIKTTADGKVYKGIQAQCNSNGQWTAHSFEAGYATPVACKTCNPPAALPTPSERQPKADSCTALNKTTGKQCTFHGYGTPLRCNNHRGK